MYVVISDCLLEQWHDCFYGVGGGRTHNFPMVLYIKAGCSKRNAALRSLDFTGCSKIGFGSFLKRHKTGSKIALMPKIVIKSHSNMWHLLLNTLSTLLLPSEDWSLFHSPSSQKNPWQENWHTPIRSLRK